MAGRVLRSAIAANARINAAKPPTNQTPPPFTTRQGLGDFSRYVLARLILVRIERLLPDFVFGRSRGMMKRPAESGHYRGIILFL